MICAILAQFDNYPGRVGPGGPGGLMKLNGNA